MSGDERGPTRSGSFAAASAGGNPSGRADQAPRDRDPPPSYDGENPEVTFRQFEKQIALWEFETEIPKAKRGVKLLRQLSGTAATAVDDMEVADIATEHGVKNVMNKLRDYFMPHLEVSLPRAFEAAVYGPPRGSKESFGEYTKRMERAFAVLAKEGVDLPDGARGYILYRQASLNESQEQRLLTWAEGKYGRTEITVALRRMDKVLKEKDKSRSAYLNEETFILENAAGHHYEPEESGYQDWEDDDENYVFLADGDLDEVMDEQDVLSALAAYNDTRQALKDQRLNRGYFPGKGKGKINGFQKGKDKGKRRVHIEQLKLRTRCRRCLQIGHWEKECKNPPATEKGPERSFFVGLHPESQSFSDSQHQYWLRQFVKEKRAQEGEPASKSAAKSSEQYMERACTTAEGDVQFCGITTKAIEGVVDTAAEGGLIGLELLLRLERELSTRGLRIKWVPKQTTAKGVGGTAVVEGVALIPVGIGGINGVLETTVIQGDVPLLLPVRLLKALQVLIDLKSMNMHIPSHNVSVPLHELASGHVTVNVMSFASGVFCVPPEAGRQEEFELRSSCFATSAMPAQLELTRQFDRLPQDAQRPPTSHGVAPSEGKGIGGRFTFHGPRSDGNWASSSKSPSTTSQLASGDGQDRHPPGTRSAPRYHRSVVLGLSLAAAGAQAYGDHRGLLCRGDPDGHAPEATSEQGYTEHFRQRLCAPQDEPEGWWQRIELVHRMPSVPFQVGPWRKSIRHPQEAEARPLERNLEEEGNYLTEGADYNLSDTKDAHEERGTHGGTATHTRVRAREYHVGETGPEDRAGHPRPNHDATAPQRAGGQRHPTLPAERQPDAVPGGGGEKGHSGQSGAGNSPREADANAHPSSAHPGVEAGSKSQLPKISATQGQPELLMRQAGGSFSGQERRASEGSHVLEVRSEAMRLLRMDPGGRDGGHRRCEDGGFITESEEVQKPKEGGPCGSSSGGPGLDTILPLVEGVDNQQPGGRSGGGRGRLRGLEQPEALVRCSNARAKRWARRAQRGEDPYYLIEEHYWVLQDGELVKRDGIIPKEETEVYVNFRPSRRTTFQDEWEEAKTTQLSRKNRQMIEKALKANQDKFKVTMAEVYSPPRISPLLEKMGLKVGPSYDLVTNWDLSDPHQRRAMWKSLREERPEVILACPPCTAFSRMQVINWGRMSTAKRVSMLQAGKEHLHLAIAVLKWQLRRGGGILFEHPDGATSWQEPELQALAAHHNIKTVVCDQCMFGLNVDGTGLNRKRTRWLSNMLPVIDELNLRCDGSHHHVHLDGGKPKLAQRYPDQLCQAVARGIVQYLKTKDITAWAMEEEQEEAQEEEEEVDPAQEEGPDDYEPTLEEKRAVMKVHRAVGHPQQREFVRFLRAARVRGEVVQWAAKKFTCDVCEAKRHPKAPRPTALPRAYQPNRVLGLDLFYVPAPGDGKQTTPILNILDWGTNYQMCEVIAGKNPNEVWDAYLSTWARTFGHPEVITCDAGREFLGEFIQRAAAEGIVVHQIASKAPWQQGKTERHGGHFKELLDKARSEVVVQNIKDLKQLMTEVEQAKNRYSNRSGFAPIQRQIGQWPRLPTSILSDEAIDPTLLQGVITDDIERLHHMRTVAHKAFCEYNAKDTMKRALRARPRIWVDYKPGEYVFVFRVPRLKKRKHGGITDDALATTKARWVGPGTVIAPDGANLWVSMMGELWKVAREQCRPATNDEKTGIEAVVQECQELIEEFKRGSHRAGYKDITAEEFPPEGEPAGAEENADFENPAVRQQRTRFQDHIDMDEYSPEYPDEEEPPRDPPEGHPGLPKRRRSVAEPEQEEAPPSKGGSEDEDLEAKHHPGFPEGVPETPPLPSRPLELPPVNALDPGVQEALRRSEVEANRLDGVPGPRTGPIYRWQQRAGRHDDLGPYFETAEWYLEEDDEWQEGQDQARRHRLRALQEERRDRDHWSLDLTKGELVRHHVKKRKAHFDPKFSSEMPIPVNLLSEKRQTHVRREGQEGVKEDQWTNPETKAEENWWKGKTVFHIKNLKETVHYLAEKKGQDEVNIAKETPQDQEEWKLSDLSEWNKVTQSGAVQVLGLEESQRVRRELKEQGQEDRILPTKIARRYKPGEQPGEPAVKKSRLCIRGDLDPDILDLERFSPTLNTVNFQVLLQIAANENMEATVGDLKNAFCQSRPLDRPKGKLYFQQPKEGVVGLHPDQIVMIIAGCYGLVDAPLHWRKSLTDDLKELGYEMSALDPCIMKLYDSTRKKLLGAIAIEVDDLFTVGHDEHHKKMEQLKKKYTFGKYVRLRHESDGCAFNGRRIRQRKDGGFLVDMQKFIQERLHPVPLEKGRKTDKKAMANDDEVSAARATCGALNWLSREGRPDASGPSSLLSSKLSKLCIEDINQMNQVVTELKANSELSLQIQPLRKMRLSVVTDASFANHGFHSQGGHLVLAHESHLRDGASVDTNILAWRSGKLQRVVNSTLAAETQSMSRGLAELLWIMVMVQELQDGKFNIKAWRSRLKGEELLVMASELDKGKLKESLAVVDAKSLFDLLSKDTIGGQDKRTAIEIQIIRQDLRELGGEVKWVDHLAMPADGLTKVLGSNVALYELIRSGRFSIRPTEEQMKRRAEARKAGQTSSEIRRIGIKEKPWNCETKDMETTMLDPNDGGAFMPKP